MSAARINLAELRARTEPRTRITLQSFEVLALVEAVEAAKAFTATTSVFRQPKSARDEFAAMAVALLRCDFGAADAARRP